MTSSPLDDRTLQTLFTLGTFAESLRSTCGTLLAHADLPQQTAQGLHEQYVRLRTQVRESVDDDQRSQLDVLTPSPDAATAVPDTFAAAAALSTFVETLLGSGQFIATYRVRHGQLSGALHQLGDQPALLGGAASGGTPAPHPGAGQYL